MMGRSKAAVPPGEKGGGAFPGSWNRRHFIQACTAAGIALGLDRTLTARIARAVTDPARPPVVWLHFQECTGCSESLLRTTHPSIQDLLFNLISLDYHETLCAAAGEQVEELLAGTIRKSAGKYICIVEGAIPTKEGGIYCKIGGRTALDILNTTAGEAAAVIAVGSCASFGGIPASPPNPTGATGVPQLLAGKPVVTIPGCPPNAYNLLGTIIHLLTFNRLPELDSKGRPRFAYGRTIHEACPRRPHFDAGRFAEKFGDAGHRNGWCLYKLGCKGPQTHANCSTLHFCDVIGAWPIGIGHPCAGCTEQDIAFRVPLFDTIEIPEPTPGAIAAPMFPPPNERSKTSPAATGFAGLVGGVLIGAALVAARRMNRGRQREDEE